MGAGARGRDVLDVLQAINAVEVGRGSESRFERLSFLADGKPSAEQLSRRAVAPVALTRSLDGTAGIECST